MAERTEIAWCDSTFNPWIGCTKVSPGCDHCYAEREWSTRRHRVVWGAGNARSRTKTWGDPIRWNKAHEAFFAAHGRRQRVFCASLADVFDNEVPARWRADLFDLIAKTPHLDWLLLTKRIGNAKRLMDEIAWNPGRLGPCTEWHPMPNVWLGATIVNQEEADRDIPKLRATPAAVRFLSMEPLLGPVRLPLFIDAARCRGLDVWTPGVDWVIVGGESGPGARAMQPEWARSLRDQCAAAGVPFLFKQWGEFLPASADADDPTIADVPDSRLYWSDGDKWDRFDGQRAGVDLVARVGKKAAGRLLDGVTHDGFPETTQP